MPNQMSGECKTNSNVTIALGERSYEIHLDSGILGKIGSLTAQLKPSRCVIVADETVAGLHLERVRNSLHESGIEASDIVLPAGEATKSFTHLETLCHELLDRKLERNDVILALGGGVIGDLAGFAASIVKRGIRLIQIPTTLLAQVDSSIGGKTGINTRHGKNLIGAFYQPDLVLIDADVLDTLPSRQLRAGYAEIAKYGLLGDAAFFAWLEENAAKILAGDKTAQIYAIEQSCRAKAAIVAEDEREHGRRALLNLGHTFGHALEAWAGYSSNLLHGEAVAIGMVLAFEMSQEMGLCEKGHAERVALHLKAAGLPTRIGDLRESCGGALPSADELIVLMAQDKKANSGKLTFILVRAIGKAFATDMVAPEQLRAFLERHCSA